MRHVVLVHGYSDKGASFAAWAALLRARGFTPHVCTYRTLTNEVSIKDIGEGFNRALLGSGVPADAPFDAVVHSTGMLVVRAWLTASAPRQRRLKRLVALAPATFGSPLAHKGRTWLGALFKGNKDIGPDFLEAGNLVLDGLELGSRFTWDLAHRDLFVQRPWSEPLAGDAPERTVYGPGGDTPFVFTFCGTEAYKGLQGVVNEPGSDGTVRLAGCALTSRKVTIDFTEEGRAEVRPTRWQQGAAALVPMAGMNHGTILSDPTEDLQELVLAALEVGDAASFDAWTVAARAKATVPARHWQQFVVRATDERGDPIPDYHVELFTKKGAHPVPIRAFSEDVHAYKADPSLRSFHLDVAPLRGTLSNLWMRVWADAGTDWVGYHGHEEQKLVTTPAVDLTPWLSGGDFRFFFPFTTTLLELRLDREPLPRTGRNRVCWFHPLEG